MNTIIKRQQKEFCICIKTVNICSNMMYRFLRLKILLLQLRFLLYKDLLEAPQRKNSSKSSD